MNGEDEEFAHGANGSIPASVCKTARRGGIASHYEFATHTLNRDLNAEHFSLERQPAAGISIGPSQTLFSAPFADFEHVTIGIVEIELTPDEHTLLSILLEQNSDAALS